MYKFLASLGFAVTAAVAGTAGAQTGGIVAGTAPGKTAIAGTVKLTATITDIDKVTRDVTLKGAQGNVLTLTAGPDVKNFANLKVGAQANVEYLQGQTLEVMKGGTRVVGRAGPKGAVGPAEKPAGIVGRTVTIVANVVAVDKAKQTVTLKGLRQRAVDLRIPNPEQFKRIEQGDQVQAWYTQAVAISIEQAAKK
jgi:hypothetical protein